MAFDAIISEFLRFLKDRKEDLENCEARQRIASILTSELMVNENMGLQEFSEHVSKRMILDLAEMAFKSKEVK